MTRVNPSTRLYVLLARNSPVGVIFRRGPSKHVQLIRWELTDDSLEAGQWLKGRIYERRCDLSPEGDMLLYFAANWRRPYQSWSAISRPPYLTALALWPKGDGWGGGGLFKSRECLLLNHRSRSYEWNLADGFVLPEWLAIEPFGDRSGWGEDEPPFWARLERDGWKCVLYPTRTKDERGSNVWIEYDPPITWEKPSPVPPIACRLQMRILGIKERDGPWYLADHVLVREGDQPESLGRSDWADWASNGDLLFARSGCLYRLSRRGGRLPALSESRLIADLSQNTFEQKEAPAWALEWPRKKRVRTK